MNEVQKGFVERVIPVMDKTLGWLTRNQLDPDQAEEILQDATCEAWRVHLVNLNRGYDAAQDCPTILAKFAIMAVLAGKGFARKRSPQDAYGTSGTYGGRTTRNRRSLVVYSEKCEDYQEFARDEDDPAEIVQAKLDFEKWFQRLRSTHRTVIELLLDGLQVKEIAAKLSMDRTHISWVRGYLWNTWKRFIET